MKKQSRVRMGHNKSKKIQSFAQRLCLNQIQQVRTIRKLQSGQKQKIELSGGLEHC